jgi:hypothetical protein
MCDIVLEIYKEHHLAGVNASAELYLVVPNDIQCKAASCSQLLNCRVYTTTFRFSNNHNGERAEVTCSIDLCNTALLSGLRSCLHEGRASRVEHIPQTNADFALFIVPLIAVGLF